jgi:serine/threonine protein kinase
MTRKAKTCRDVKPANILVENPKPEIRHPDEDLKAQIQNPKPVAVKLTDFGIGQVVSEEYLKGITRAGFTQTMASGSSSGTGTQLYMAPELLAGKPASIRSDICLIGICFSMPSRQYEVRSGRARKNPGQTKVQ